MPKVHKLQPNIVQLKYTGKEPTWEKFNETRRNAEVLVAFNWYNYHFGPKEVLNLVSDYLLLNERTEEHKKWAKVQPLIVPNAIGWYCRMISKGYPATEAEIKKVETAISHALANVPEQAKTRSEDKTEENAKNKANVQELMRERANLLGGELEHMIDEYISQGAKGKHEFSPITEIKKANILVGHVPALIEHWEKVKIEFVQAKTGVVKELVEAYNNFNKIQLRNLIKFCDLIIADLNSYVTYKKVTKTPRKRKAITPAMQVKKLKYSKEHKELNLKSVKPEKIIGAKEMFVYSPKKRKLHYYVADEASGNALMVKNNTIIGFDPTRTVMKTVRKPDAVIKEFMKASRPKTRKIFKDIKAVEARLSGRFADDLVILKVF